MVFGGKRGAVWLNQLNALFPTLATASASVGNLAKDGTVIVAGIPPAFFWAAPFSGGSDSPVIF